MAKKPPYRLNFAPIVYEHMKCIDAKYHSLIRQAINQQLRFEPLSETRNRKPLLEPTSLEADWELRFGPNNRFRVFYAVD